MIEHISKLEFELLVKENNYDVFSHNQIAVKSDKVLNSISKGVTTDIEKIELVEFSEEIKALKAYSVEEMTEKGLVKSFKYVLPKQVEWNEDLFEKGEGKEKQEKNGKYLDTELNRKLDRVGKSVKSEEKDDEKKDIDEKEEKEPSKDEKEVIEKKCDVDKS